MIEVVAPLGFEPEKTYAIHLLLHELLGLPYHLRFDSNVQAYEFRLPNGQQLTIRDDFFRPIDPATTYLKAALLPTCISESLSPFDQSSICTLFGVNDRSDGQDELWLGIDIVASTFLMATRWEEAVQPEQRDLYGRFSAEASLAYQYGFLERPVVHEWAEYLWMGLVRLGWPEHQRKKRQAEIVLSCDVDYPKQWWQPWQRVKTLAGALVRGRLRDEWACWRNNGFFNDKDPFDTFDELMAWANTRGQTQVQFNFLGHRPRNFDAWYDLEHPYVKGVMEKVAKAGHIVGFHPSREAATDTALFSAELESLRAVSPIPITSGRHHYLCFDAPRTWQVWEDHGLAMDSTLGYSGAPGFRAGLCVDYPVFNIHTRQMLRLREQPLVAMDVSFLHYLKFSVGDMEKILLSLHHQTYRFGGQFTLLWHNSSMHTGLWTKYWTCLSDFKK